MKSAPSKIFVTAIVVTLAVLASGLMYVRYVSRPWTRDAQVRANVVGIAPRVDGPIINIPLQDNQPVKKGDLLFEIDPSTYQAAEANAAANLKKVQSTLEQAKQKLARQTALYEKKVTDLRNFQDAQDEYSVAVADTVAAEATLKTAGLNLSYTKVVATVDGYMTNMNTSVGQYVNAGEELLALVDGTSFWIAAYFKETQLRHVHVGDKVRVTLMGHESEGFAGEVVSVAWGIFLQNGSTVDLLPEVSQTVDWVRLPNRFPVRVKIVGQPPVPLRIGQTASATLVGK
jgi:RND family efflux transporter MFP subunit